MSKKNIHKKEVFSLRKLNIGFVSVMIGSFFFIVYKPDEVRADLNKPESAAVARSTLDAAKQLAKDTNNSAATSSANYTIDSGASVPASSVEAANYDEYQVSQSETEELTSSLSSTAGDTATMTNAPDINSDNQQSTSVAKTASFLAAPNSTDLTTQLGEAKVATASVPDTTSTSVSTASEFVNAITSTSAAVINVTSNLDLTSQGTISVSSDAFCVI